MGEMEDKLNAILNDPSAMGQIMALAQSLGGGAPRPQASPAGEAAQGAEQTGAREAEAPASAGSAPPALTGGEEPLAALGEIDPGMIQMGMPASPTLVWPLAKATPKKSTPMNFCPSCAPCIKLMAAALAI